MQGCREAGMQGGRDAGMQGCRDAGRQGGRDTGMQVCREAGRQGGRVAGMQGCEAPQGEGSATQGYSGGGDGTGGREPRSEGRRIMITWGGIDHEGPPGTWFQMQADTCTRALIVPVPWVCVPWVCVPWLCVPGELGRRLAIWQAGIRTGTKARHWGPNLQPLLCS